MSTIPRSGDSGTRKYGLPNKQRLFHRSRFQEIHEADDLPEEVYLSILDSPPACLHLDMRSGAKPTTFAPLGDGVMMTLDHVYRLGECKILSRRRREYPDIDPFSTIKNHYCRRKARMLGFQFACRSRRSKPRFLMFWLRTSRPDDASVVAADTTRPFNAGRETR